MNPRVDFNVDLIKRYGIGGPRYTSYPRVDRFNGDVTEDDYRKWARVSNEDPIPRPLSLYLHIPFSEAQCLYSAGNDALINNHAAAEIYLEHLYREIATLAPLFDKDRIVEQIHWGGGTPTFFTGKVIRKIMSLMRRKFSLRTDDKGEYSIVINPASCDISKLHVLQELGFNRVSLCVQAVNYGVSNSIDAIQFLEKTREVASTIRGMGYKSINMDLIYGMSCQTVTSFGMTLQAAIDIQPDRLALHNYAHLPPRFRPLRHPGETELPGTDDSSTMLKHSIDQLSSAGYVYVGMDHFARPDDELVRAQRLGSLQHNFQGYSIHAACDLVGLGVSAISKVCDNYCQNGLALDEYYARIDCGELPIKTGIELEPDDLLRGEIISQLICRFVVNIEALENKWKINFLRHFRSEMQELIKMGHDGLLRLNRESLEILPAGRLLVSHVCMVFDRYLHDDGTGS